MTADRALNFSASRTLANGHHPRVCSHSISRVDGERARRLPKPSACLDAGTHLIITVATFKSSLLMTTAIGLQKTSGAQLDYYDKRGAR